MKYVAVRIKGDVFIMNVADELGGLIDNDIEHETLGTVCDEEEYGDHCNTDCPLYRSGTCRSVSIRDVHGKMWHVVPPYYRN